MLKGAIISGQFGFWILLRTSHLSASFPQESSCQGFGQRSVFPRVLLFGDHETSCAHQVRLGGGWLAEFRRQSVLLGTWQV